MTDLTETIGRELVTLLRGTKDLQGLIAADRDQPVIDPPAFALLSRIGEQGPLRLSVLAGCLYLDVSTISRQVQELESAGWVVRERDPHDGRASLLRLTDEGRTVLRSANKQRTRALTQLLAGWSDDERSQLAQQFQRFNQAVAEFRTTAHLGTAELHQETA